MSFDPSSIVSLIQNCIKVYNYAADVKHSSAERGRLLDEVRSLQSELEALQRLANTPGIAGDQASMERLGKLLDSSQSFAKAVDETLTRVKDVLTYGTSNPNATRFKVLGKQLVAALKWTVDKVEVKDLLSDLERYKSRIVLAVQHDMFNHVINEYRLKIAKFISKNDFTGHQEGLLQQKLKNTGTWLMQDPKFVAWREDRESSRTLWCYGDPGVGKSVMAASIVDHLQSGGDVVLSVFCRYSSDTFTNPCPVLCGLLRQLIEKSSNVLPTLCDLYQSQTHPNPDTLPIFLAEIAASHERPIYVVIDALDECQIVLELLCAIQQLGLSFRVLVTSRPVFKEIEKQSSIEIWAPDDDILVAIDTTLSRLKLKHGWLDEELTDTIIQKVVEEADGMFLLASLLLRELERDVTCRRDILDILDSLPHTLDDAYKLMFQRIREQGERKNELACRTVALVALKTLPDIQYIQHLLVEGDRTQCIAIETIVQCCHGLVQDDDGDLVFIHYSVHEYTTTRWLELFPEYPNRIDLCLKLGYSVLARPIYGIRHNFRIWYSVIKAMRKPEELNLVISSLSTPAARASLLMHYFNKLKPFVHDPLLIACCLRQRYVMEYVIQTAPPDVQRLNEALCASMTDPEFVENTQDCIKYINARPDMRVNSDGVVVAVDPNEDEENSSSRKFKEDETSADGTLIRPDN